VTMVVRSIETGSQTGGVQCWEECNFVCFARHTFRIAAVLRCRIPVILVGRCHDWRESESRIFGFAVSNDGGL